MLPSFGTILYATGLGPRAAEVFRYAMLLAQAHGGRIVLVHALEPLGSTGKTMVEHYLSEEERRRFEADGRARVLASIRGRLEAFCEDGCSTPEDRGRISEIRVVHGRPADVILRAAEEVGADVIVMGTHAHSVLGEVLLGSTAHRVTQRSAVPVLLVRSGRAAERAGSA